MTDRTVQGCKRDPEPHSLTQCLAAAKQAHQPVPLINDLEQRMPVDAVTAARLVKMVEEYGEADHVTGERTWYHLTRSQVAGSRAIWIDRQPVPGGTPEAIMGWADQVMTLIGEHIAEGWMPGDVGSYEELHNHTDANVTYGLYVLGGWAGHISDNDDDPAGVENLRIANALSDEVDRRLRARPMSHRALCADAWRNEQNVSDYTILPDEYKTRKDMLSHMQEYVEVTLPSAGRVQWMPPAYALCDGCDHLMSEHDSEGCQHKMPRADWCEQDTDPDVYCGCTERTTE